MLRWNDLAEDQKNLQVERHARVLVNRMRDEDGYTLIEASPEMMVIYTQMRYKWRKGYCRDDLTEMLLRNLEFWTYTIKIALTELRNGFFAEQTDNVFDVIYPQR